MGLFDDLFIGDGDDAAGDGAGTFGEKVIEVGEVFLGEIEAGEEGEKNAECEPLRTKPSLPSTTSTRA